mgnify:CR=1 FL=1
MVSSIISGVRELDGGCLMWAVGCLILDCACLTASAGRDYGFGDVDDKTGYVNVFPEITLYKNHFNHSIQIE